MKHRSNHTAELQVDDLLELVKSKNLEIGKVINTDFPKEELLKSAKKGPKLLIEKMIKTLIFILKELQFLKAQPDPQLNT